MVRANLRNFYNVHSVVNWKKYSHQKNVSSNQLCSNFFSKNIAFTKFLPKISVLTDVMCTLQKLVKANIHKHNEYTINLTKILEPTTKMKSENNSSYLLVYKCWAKSKELIFFHTFNNFDHCANKSCKWDFYAAHRSENN